MGVGLAPARCVVASHTRGGNEQRTLRFRLLSLRKCDNLDEVALSIKRLEAACSSMKVKLKWSKVSPVDTILQIDCISARPDTHAEDHRLPWTLRVARACFLTAIVILSVASIVASVVLLEQSGWLR